MLGPVLLEYGTEEQKREHLPKIVRDKLASLKMRQRALQLTIRQVMEKTGITA